MTEETLDDKCIFKAILEKPPVHGDGRLAYVLIRSNPTAPCKICQGYDTSCDYYTIK